jgi:hypothetical protein
MVIDEPRLPGVLSPGSLFARLEFAAGRGRPCASPGAEYRAMSSTIGEEFANARHVDLSGDCRRRYEDPRSGTEPLEAVSPGLRPAA